METRAEAQAEFVRKEYDALRAELLGLIGDARSLERYIAVGCAAIWAWIAAHPQTPKLTLALPIVLAVLGYLRDKSYGKAIDQIGLYLREAEGYFLQPLAGEPPPPKGWETTKEQRDESGEPAFVLWATLLAVGVLAFLILPNPVGFRVAGQPQPAPPAAAATGATGGTGR